MGVSHTSPAFRGPGSHEPASEPVSADDPQVLAGHRPTARIGATALGRVYLAQAPGERQAVLTVVHAELAAQDGFGARFHREAQAAGRIRAVGAPRVLGSGNEGSTYWIASAYVPAPTLAEVVATSGPLPTGVVLRLVAGLAEALLTMHHAGVVHGDLRPAHVLLAADGPKAVQYGMSALADVAAGGGAPPAFLAPEQVAGGPAVAATDVFALGQLAAYASIGRPPFDDPARAGQEEPDLNELPGELREIVTRCMIKDPALRPSLAQVTAMCRQAAPGPVAGPVGGHGAGPFGGVAPGSAAAGEPPAGGGAPAAGVLPPPSPVHPAVHPAAVPPLAAAHVPPPAAPGGMMHGAFGWVPRPAAVRRRTGAGVVLAGLAVVVLAGFGLAQGIDGSGGSGERPALGAEAPPSAPPTAAPPDSSPTAAPTAAPATPSSPAASPPAGDPQPDGAATYDAIRLPAGTSLSLQEQPPAVLPGSFSGAIGFTTAADAFTVDEHRGRLALLPAGLPPTPEACMSAAGPQTVSIPRQDAQTPGARVCVHTVDDTIALVTFDRITPRGAQDPYAVVDVTVWRIPDRSAGSDRNGVFPVRSDAIAVRNS